MKTKSLKGTSLDEIRSAVETSISPDFSPNLAMVFLSYKQDIQSVCELLNEKNIQIFGATTGGEFIDGEILDGGIVMLLLELNPSYFSLKFEDKVTGDARLKSKEMSQELMQDIPKPSFLSMATGLTIDGELVISGIEAAAGKDTTIFGGMAGDDLRVQQTYVFSNDGISSQGILILAFDQTKISMQGRAINGWKPLGTRKTITKSEGWWIYEIDHQPALELVQKFTGNQIKRVDDIDVLSPDESNVFPLQLHRNEGNPIIRPILLIDWVKGAIKVNGSVSEGNQIQLSLPADFDIIEEVVNDCQWVKENEFPEADALIMFSCVGRHAALGPLISEEIEGVRNTYDAPMAGLFTYGEFGRATHGTHEYHNLTCAWVGLKEK
ncbi:MAG: FIST N-terminal domain-containing protein [Bacteroidia bacterium]|nr:FIST N-terminal domain-containing protein [Bacteroidia bacterium]